MGVSGYSLEQIWLFSSLLGSLIPGQNINIKQIS